MLNEISRKTAQLKILDHSPHLCLMESHKTYYTYVQIRTATTTLGGVVNEIQNGSYDGDDVVVFEGAIGAASVEPEATASFQTQTMLTSVHPTMNFLSSVRVK